MFRKTGITLTALILSVYLSLARSQCRVEFKKELSEKDPLFLTKDGRLMIPESAYLHWEVGDEGVISCTGTNLIANELVTEASIRCNAKTGLQMNKKAYDTASVNCSSGITGDILTTSESCGNKNIGTVQKIGFQTTLGGFLDLIDICYDMNMASVLYSHHYIYGKAAKYTVSESNRPAFKSTGTPKHTKPQDAYKQQNQVSRFSDVLGSQVTAKYFNSTSFLARGHLTPDHDNLFRSWQYASFFYVNAAPEWQAINAGNWLRIETLARAKAIRLDDTIEVFTGVHGILSLPNDEGKEIELTLEPDGILPVPLYYWKILVYEKTAIAFLTLNNPFAESVNLLCDDICDKYGWSHPSFSDFPKGYTYCCKVADVMKFIKHIPKEAKPSYAKIMAFE